MVCVILNIVNEINETFSKLMKLIFCFNKETKLQIYIIDVIINF